MNIEITKETHTITIDTKELINKNSGFIFDDKFIYIYEKKPFVDYNIEDLEQLELCGKIIHKIRYFINV